MNSNFSAGRPELGDSRRVNSTQSGLHRSLDKLVHKHLASRFIKPLAQHNIESYKYALKQVNKPHIIFDSGCGNGKSTSIIARQNPDAFVIGIDKSELRLDKQRPAPSENDPENYCTVRADLIDFFRLAHSDGIQLYKHFFLYPNPWPKKQHLHRRWQGSPVFSEIVKLGGAMEVRTNWKIYVEEFARALHLAGIGSEVTPLAISNQLPISDFEAKYFASGHSLWQLRSNS